MNRAVLFLVWMLPVTSVAQEDVQLPIQPPRWALLSVSQSDSLTAEVLIGTRPEIVHREYEVRVPYQKVNPDGSKVTAFRTVTKMKDIRIEQSITKKVELESKDVVLLKPNGKRYQFDESIKKRLSKPLPALLLTTAEQGRFYEAVLKPDTMIVVVPKESLPKQE